MNISELCVAFGSRGWRARNASHLFVSDESFRWFLRRHLGELIEQGAVVQVAGRLLVHLPTIDQVVLDLFRRDALGDRRRGLLQSNPLVEWSKAKEASATRRQRRRRPRLGNTAIQRGTKASSAGQRHYGDASQTSKRSVLTLKRKVEA